MKRTNVALMLDQRNQLPRCGEGFSFKEDGIIRSMKRKVKFQGVLKNQAAATLALRAAQLLGLLYEPAMA